MSKSISLFCCFTFHIAALVQAGDGPLDELSASERELVQLCTQMYAAYDSYYSAAEKLSTDDEREKYYAANDPGEKYVLALVEMERANHGTRAGLMAARRLILIGSGGIDGYHDIGRRHALAALPSYSGAPELPEILRYLDSGLVEPKCEECLRRLIEESGVSDLNRNFARLMLARWSLAARDGREYQEHRLKEIAQGSPPRYPKESEYLSTWFARALAPEKLVELERESIEILESLAEFSLTMRQPAIVGIDDHYFVIRVDAEKTASMPLLKELAAGSLFKEQHLRVGKPAPDLQLQLVNGGAWSLADQRGKTVVIQFSFKGCGPCEAMYPDLRALIEEHKEKLVVLGVMADEKREVTIKAVNSGKLSWNVYWDGSKGPVSTKWAVRGFPTVYIIGPDGRIAAYQLRGDRLKAKVAELTR